jgi:hypothetical protein
VSAVVCVPAGLNVRYFIPHLGIVTEPDVVLQKRGELVDDRVPTNVFVVELENAGLAVRATKDSPIRFRKGWEAKACEDWLEGLLPQVFKFIKDKQSGKFTLLTKKGKKLEPVP